jgi:mannose-6-phosphate isomerase
MQPILKFKPIYKDKIWGGRKLETILGRKIPDGNIGESWEVSDYGNDLSIIENGILKGKTFREVYKSHTKEILGDVFKSEEDFPLLVKIIDAKDKLSVQVHPDNAYAAAKDPESSGKKEAWFILATDPGAEIVCGFCESLSRERYAELIASNQAESCLQSVKAKAGDAFMINPGTVHAIGGGNLLLEVQQSSDSTYRVYDYGRLGDDGKPRKLHLEKALDVLNFKKSSGEEIIKPQSISWESGVRKVLAANDKFRLELLEFSKEISIPPSSKEKVFQIVYVISGECEIDSEKLKTGNTFLITAQGVKEDIRIKPISGNLQLAVMGVGSDWVTYL